MTAPSAPRRTYTPGPWRLDDAQRNVLALKIKHICEVPGYGVISTGVDKANARLIAAAPALLAALKLALDQTDDGLCDIPDCWVERAHVVIRAALGLEDS